MSIITAPPVTGDLELARLLTSAAVYGWHGVDDLDAVASRCAWPAWLCTAVAALPERQVLELATASRRLWSVFAAPTDSSATLRRLIGHPRLELSDEEQLVVAVHGSGRRLSVSAALGLVHALTAHGHDSLGICAWRSCRQPVIRTGRTARRAACSPECANRTRVARHRDKHAIRISPGGLRTAPPS